MRHLRSRTALVAATAGLMVVGLGAAPASAEEVCVPVTTDGGVCVAVDVSGGPARLVVGASVTAYGPTGAVHVRAGTATGHVLDSTDVCMLITDESGSQTELCLV